MVKNVRRLRWLAAAGLAWGCTSEFVPDTNADASTTTGAVPAALYLNEIAAQGTPVGTFNPSGGDWVELYNTTTSTVDLQSYKLGGLTNGLPGALPLPPGTSIAAGAYLIVYFNHDNIGEPVLDDKLKVDGSLAIWDASGKMLDQVDWELDDTIKGGSYGRSPDGGTKWKTFEKGKATPAKANLP